MHELIEHYDLEIHCSNVNGRSYKYQLYCDNIQEVTRVLITFKPKRNYHIIGVFCSLVNRWI